MVRVIERSEICPFSNSIPSTFSLPLTHFDLICLKFCPSGRLFFYPLPTHSHSLFESTIIPNLKLSLCLTLQHFFPLAGVLVWPDNSSLPFISYSRNDAVSFVFAESLADFDALSSPRPVELRHLRSLLPSFHSHSNSLVPLCAIQVTHFPNHGFSIGFSIHHVIADGQSFNLFLKSWVHICYNLNHLEPSSNLPPQLIPCFDRSVDNMISNPLEFVPKDRNLSYNLSLLVPSDWTLAIFDLTLNQIQDLKRKALKYWTTTKESKREECYFSTFVVGYAHALVCLAKAKGDECKETFYVTFAADVRSVLYPTISTNYFGNCVTNLSVVVETRELRDEENGFSMVAKKIGDSILKLKEKGGIEVAKPFLNEGKKFVGEFEICSIGDSPKYKFYETDFGWGKPKQVENVLLGNNNLFFIDCRDGDGGVQLALNLPTHHMDVFASLFIKET